MFKVGDLVRRIQFNSYWRINSNDDKGTLVFRVTHVRGKFIDIYHPKVGAIYEAREEYFQLEEDLTKEQKLLNKINKLYKKCPSTAKWVTE